MAVLKTHTNYKSGDTVTAQIVNDTIETAILASENANEAKQFAEKANALSTEASKQSTLATQDARAAVLRADQAIAEAHEALEKADDVTTKAQRGEFNGANGVIVPIDGMFGLQIVDGNLVAFYEDGAEAPNLHIDEDGNLIYEII